LFTIAKHKTKAKSLMPHNRSLVKYTRFTNWFIPNANKGQHCVKMLHCGLKHYIVNNLQILKHHRKSCQLAQVSRADIIDMEIEEYGNFHATKLLGLFFKF
jgi:hypothetical protein